MKKELQYVREHLKGTEKENIECTYWSCPHRTIRFAQDALDTKVEHTCSRTGKNLGYWPYSQSPNWCPRRKINGGY